MAQIEKGAKRYPSDLTNEEWERIAPLLSTPPRLANSSSVMARCAQETCSTSSDG